MIRFYNQDHSHPLLFFFYLFNTILNKFHLKSYVKAKLSKLSYVKGCISKYSETERFFLLYGSYFKNYFIGSSSLQLIM